MLHSKNIGSYCITFLDRTVCYRTRLIDLIVLGFNDTSTLVGHFVSSPREREKRNRRNSRGDEREGRGRRKMNESEEIEEVKTFPLCCKGSRPCPTVSQYQLDTPVTQDTRHLCLISPCPPHPYPTRISYTCGQWRPRPAIHLRVPTRPFTVSYDSLILFNSCLALGKVGRR